MLGRNLFDFDSPSPDRAGSVEPAITAAFARPAFPAAEQNGFVRSCAVMALGMVRSQPDVVVPVLVRALERTGCKLAVPVRKVVQG